PIGKAGALVSGRDAEPDTGTFCCDGVARHDQETGLRRSWAIETTMGHSGPVHEGHPRRHETATAAATVQTAGVARQTVELMALLCLGVLLVRTFSAEAYVAPTGSMAPTLMGVHRAFQCPVCHAAYVVGLDEDEPCGEAICPECGKRALDTSSSLECGGDRVLVEKFLYGFRKPRRWEVAVFHFPGETSQAYVKRVIGLPGEAVRILDGDVFIDNRIARKSFAEIRAMRILVHDSQRQARDLSGPTRWIFQCGASPDSQQS